MAAEESGLALPFLFDSGRGEHEVEVSDGVVGENCPELAFNEFGKFFAQEVGVIPGRLVAASLDAGVLLFCCPGFGGVEYWDPMVPPFPEERSCWVV